MWGEHDYTLEDRIKEIEKASDYELWQSALALVLTIPDICGQIEFKDVVNKNGARKVGAQYRKWFEKYVEPYYCKHSKHKNTNKSYFTAKMCWQLRNAFLHSGTDSIEENNEKGLYSFKLRLNSVNSYSIKEDGKVECVYIDVKTLCDSICRGAEDFMKQWDNKNDFLEKNCTWLDVKQFSKEMHKYNG